MAISGQKIQHVILKNMNYKPNLIFWETTRACNLHCPHCRASAENDRSPLDLTTAEAKQFIDSASTFSKPILVFSGGEPLLRDDIYELASYAGTKGLKPTMATNAALITEKTAKELKDSGIKIIAVSIYGASPKIHDEFCGESGTFNKTLAGIENIKKTGIDLQINTTITKKNLNELENIYRFALTHNATAYHVFFLVPTGRGKSIEGDEISPEGYENAFNRLYDIQKNSSIRIKATCAPHYYRVVRQRNQSHRVGGIGQKGCLAGQGVCFISHKGEVFGCGYLPISAGDLRKDDFRTIWFKSNLFKTLRDDSKLKDRCGICEFKRICGGCRARAYAQTGDYLDEEPYCIYTPKKDKLLLNRIQNNFPIASNPYKVLAKELNIPEEDIFNRIKDLIKKGVIRRIGANFNSNKLGYKSTLIAMKVPDEKLEEVASIINRFKGVTHNYLRDGTYNLWFTLIGDHLNKIKEETGINDLLDLPVIRQFKINAEFNV